VRRPRAARGIAPLGTAAHAYARTVIIEWGCEWYLNALCAMEGVNGPTPFRAMLACGAKMRAIGIHSHIVIVMVIVRSGECRDQRAEW
jgi:hypothetical protein